MAELGDWVSFDSDHSVGGDASPFFSFDVSGYLWRSFRKEAFCRQNATNYVVVSRTLCIFASLRHVMIYTM
jgi:hypothetical protein